MRTPLRLVWSEPRAPGPPVRARRRWLLLGALVAIALLERAARPDLPLASLLVGIAVLPTLLWRRTRPLLMVAIAFGAGSAVELAGVAIGGELPALHTTAFLLLLPYALFRWGSGREAAIGLPIMLAAASLDLVTESATVGDVVGAWGILLLAMAIGAAVRFRDRARFQQLEQVKLREREQLARDLHDTVAHHVSAIAIRAQAGLATAPTRHESAVDALRVIEAEASRTLAEMRTMVRLLRHDPSADLAPTPGIADLPRLAGPSVDGPDVEVAVSGDVGDVSPAVSAAVYRLAQESITNARRHARRATRIEVEVAADDASVRLRVGDDGDLAQARPHAAAGYGLIGMTERAEMLGGTCRAGPGPGRGWTVTAVLPRHGPAA